MGQFITAHSRIEQTDKQGYFKTIDNELYMDDNGQLYLVPRYFWTDGYTFPKIVMAILGDKNKYDVRPPHGHDICCRFHQCITVNASLTQLKFMNIIRKHKGTIICEDIPTEYLQIEKISKFDADNLFYRMMSACNINWLVKWIIRVGAIFNINWLRTGKKSLTSYNIYNEDIGLVNGF